MGSFDETCAITRTTIKQFDPIVIVVHHNHGLETSTYNLGTALWSFLQYKKNAPKDMQNYKEQISDLGKEFELHEGTYNDYGWVDEVKQPSQEFWLNDRDKYFMVHRKVWNEIAGRDVNLEGLRRLQKFAYMARIQLFWPDRLIGAQFGYGEHTWGPQEKAIRLAWEIIEEQKERWVK